MLALVASTTMPRPGEAQIAASDLQVFFRGGVRAASVTLTNTSHDPQQLNVDVQDWTRTTTGDNRFVPLGTEPHSCGDRLQVFPQSMRLEAGGTASLRLSVAGAADSGCWAIVFVQDAGPPRDAVKQGGQLNFIFRTGIKVYVEPPGAVARGEIDAFADTLVGPEEKRVRGFAVGFANTGTTHLTVSGTVEFRDESNRIVARVPAAEFYVTPEARRELEIPFPTLASGRYVALLLLDYHGSEIAAAQLEVRIS